MLVQLGGREEGVCLGLDLSFGVGCALKDCIRWVGVAGFSTEEGVTSRELLSKRVRATLLSTPGFSERPWRYWELSQAEQTLGPWLRSR